MRDPRVKDTKLTLRLAFIVNIFPLGCKQEEEKDRETIFLEVLRSFDLCPNLYPPNDAYTCFLGLF